jgi:hypothetical protein
MKPIQMAKLLSAAKKAALKTKYFEDGTISLDNEVYDLMFVLRTDTKAAWMITATGSVRRKFFVVGRENFAPLRGLFTGRTGVGCLLRKHRCLETSSASAVIESIDLISKLGSSTANDIYVFPEAGGWLIYVSHHDEILVFI